MLHLPAASRALSWWVPLLTYYSTQHFAPVLAKVMTVHMMQQGARTDVSAVTSAPDFVNRVFVLHVPSGEKSCALAFLTCELHAVSGTGM